MNDSTLWWLLAGMLVAAELGTGSFYLLALALAAACGALAAHAGLALSTQVVIAAVAALLGTSAWYQWRKRSSAEQLPAQADRNVNLDIGETVQVATWDAQGRALVQYRGAQWQARYAGTGMAAPGTFRIKALNGNQLELEPA
jgi:membrane protein implicated in regulation of membrane protease activity